MRVNKPSENWLRQSAQDIKKGIGKKKPEYWMNLVAKIGYHRKYTIRVLSRTGKSRAKRILDHKKSIKVK